MLAAIAVLYHVIPSVLRRLLDDLVGQVDVVLLMDNTPTPSPVLKEILKNYSESVFYIPLGDNLGIATAQNIGIRKCIDQGYEYVLLLDQDSALPQGMVQTLLKAEQKLTRTGQKVAAIGPQFIDEKTGTASLALRRGYFGVKKIFLDASSDIPVETDHVIASGSLISISTLKTVGLMRDELFIDQVDIEWGLRARQMGFLSYYAPNAVMRHSIGDDTKKVFGRVMHLHNDIRNYYLLRNSIHLMGQRSMGLRWKITFGPRIPFYLVLFTWFSADRWKCARLLLYAIWDGIRGRLGRLEMR